MGPVYFEN